MTLKQARKAVGWSQTRLAQKSRVGQQQISRLERDEVGQPSYETVVRLVTALQRAGLRGITADELFPVEMGERAS